MIHIDFGESDGRVSFRWSCDTCGTDEQAIRRDEGLNFIAWHLHYHRRRHSELELQDLTEMMLTALPKIPAEYWPGGEKPSAFGG